MWKIKRNLSRFCYLGTLFVFSLTISASTGPIENEFAQTQQSKKKITGTVNDQSGPLIGVTVSVDGTTNGTMTDDNGNFILSDVPEGAKLKISYVGYKTQIISIGGQATFDITLEEENQQLDEVIVVGYGTQKKSDYTGAVSAVGEKELRMSPPEAI